MKKLRIVCDIRLFIHSTADRAQSLLIVTGELYGFRVADLNISNGTSTGRNRGLESTNSSCTDSDFLSIFNLSQATARIERKVLSRVIYRAVLPQASEKVII